MFGIHIYIRELSCEQAVLFILITIVGVSHIILCSYGSMQI